MKSLSTAALLSTTAPKTATEREIMKEYIHGVMETADEIAEIEYKLDNAIIMSYILNSLPDSYCYLVVSLESQLGEISIQDLSARLVDEQIRSIRQQMILLISKGVMRLLWREWKKEIVEGIFLGSVCIMERSVIRRRIVMQSNTGEKFGLEKEKEKSEESGDIHLLLRHPRITQGNGSNWRLALAILLMRNIPDTFLRRVNIGSDFNRGEGPPLDICGDSLTLPWLHSS